MSPKQANDEPIKDVKPASSSVVARIMTDDDLAPAKDANKWSVTVCIRCVRRL